MSEQTKRISDYKETGDSLNLKTIDGQNFTIVDWEKSDFEKDGKSTNGIKFTTEEKFDNGLQKLHTTRQVIVQKFYKVKDGKVEVTKLGEAVKSGIKFQAKCVSVKPKGSGNDYFDLIDAEPQKGTLD